MKRIPSRTEENQSSSLSKINVKQSSNSQLFDNSRVKKSGYLLQGGHPTIVQVSLGHKKSASHAQVHYGYNSPGKEKTGSEIAHVLGLGKKQTANYFFKKPKSKNQEEILRPADMRHEKHKTSKITG